jgi:hypothetical protein
MSLHTITTLDERIATVRALKPFISGYQLVDDMMPQFTTHMITNFRYKSGDPKFEKVSKTFCIVDAKMNLIIAKIDDISSINRFYLTEKLNRYRARVKNIMVPQSALDPKDLYGEVRDIATKQGIDYDQILRINHRMDHLHNLIRGIQYDLRMKEMPELIDSGSDSE